MTRVDIFFAFVLGCDASWTFRNPGVSWKWMVLFPREGCGSNSVVVYSGDLFRETILTSRYIGLYCTIVIHYYYWGPDWNCERYDHCKLHRTLQHSECYIVSQSFQSETFLPLSAVLIISEIPTPGSALLVCMSIHTHARALVCV